MTDNPSMSPAARKAMADLARSYEGQELLVSLRFIGPVQLGPQTFANGPVQIQGDMVRVDDDNLILTIHGTAPAPGVGPVDREQTVFIEDILTLTKIGTVVGAPSLVKP
jgi:hypothetical protein